MKPDVLVIGAGVAGLMAACEASRSGARVCVVSRGRPNSVEIVGFNVPDCDPGDSAQRFFEDTLLAGEFGGDPALVAHMAYSITEIYSRLEAEGLNMHGAEGKRPTRLAADNRFRRTIYHLDHTGPRLLKFLRDRALALGVEIIGELSVFEILCDVDGVAAGVRVRNGRAGGSETILAGAVVLAAGGLGGIYGFHTNSPGIMGESYAMAYRAGCELVDMEYIQFEPFIMVGPRSARGYAIPTTIVTNDGAVVSDSKEQNVLPQNRDGSLRGVTKWAMSRAMFLSIQSGGNTPNGGLWLDCRSLDNSILSGYPRFLQACKNAEIDPSQERLEVAPAAHNCMGGARIDATTATTVPGLFACGEAAGGIHGGNRMAGNSGPDCLVFGKTAGLSAAAWSLRPHARARPARLPSQPSPVVPRNVLKQPDALRQMMWEHVGLARTATGLAQVLPQLHQAVAELGNLAGSDSSETHEWRSMAITSLLVATAAELRRESRGAHFRQDFPARDDLHYYGSVVLRKGDHPDDLRTRWLPLASRPSVSNLSPNASQSPWNTNI